VTDISSADLTDSVAARSAKLGHQPLVAVPDNYEPVFECPSCRSLVMGSVLGWTGWAVEYECGSVTAMRSGSQKSAGDTR
jgi:hypothetical protein